MPASFQLFVIAFAVLVFASCGGNNIKSTPAPVLLFNGTGTSVNDVTATETILDNDHLDYKTVNSSELGRMSRADFKKYQLLIIPGGNFIEMGNSLQPGTAINIRHAVQHGLNYMGICAGAFLAGHSTYYNGLDLTSGVTFGFYSAENNGTHKAALAITGSGSPPLDQYWEDGPQLSGWGMVVAKYPDGTPAVTEGKFGTGHIILAGIHPEAPENWRRGMVFNTSADTDNAYAAMLIRAALRGSLLPHY